MGELMGYPSCCVDAFMSKRARGDNLDLERAPFRAHPDHPLLPLTNRFGAVALLSHMLCAPDCAASVDVARQRLRALVPIDPTAPERIPAHLAMPVLRLDYRQAALLDGAWEGDRYVVRGLRPLRSADFGVAPDSVHAIRLASDRVAFELKDGHEHAIAAAFPLLVEPGNPLAASVQRLVVAAGVQPPTNPPGARVHENGDIAAVFAPGTRVGDHLVERSEPDETGGVRVMLSNGLRSVRVHVRPWDPSRPFLSRRGRWTFDLDAGREPSDGDRKVIGALARLLPAGDHEAGDRHSSAAR
jgi:hypothetical protein